MRYVWVLLAVTGVVALKFAWEIDGGWSMALSFAGGFLLSLSLLGLTAKETE